MRRRDFLSLVGGATAGSAVFPGAGRAQAKIFKVGYLDPGARSDPTPQHLRRQFLLGLRDLGVLEGRDFQMEDRFAEGRLERLAGLAAELAQTPVDIIVCASGEAVILAAMQASDKIPIVMTVNADPIASGVVASLARPGGNVTGMSSLASEMSGKRIELLTEIDPRISRVAVLWNPDSRSKVPELADTRSAAGTKGVSILSVQARTGDEIDVAFASILRERPHALIVLVESLTIAHRAKIGTFAFSNRLPMIAELREFADAGGLASYGVSRADLWRRSATYVYKIMRGAKPAELPVEQPVKFEMVINLKTAKALGLEVPPTILGRADEVIE
jgi:putative ABC transport system substrate-binding protein